MTNVIHLSKHAGKQASFPSQAAAALPALDRLLGTRALLVQGMQGLCDMQILPGGLIVTSAVSEQRDWRAMETNRKRA
ncbi:MAG: hypothetical protein BGO06_18385 [Shinella sp. 65-6]|nr:MAG: hypothetical protein BGO06_18385 [Shinella sp. 65-6]